VEVSYQLTESDYRDALSLYSRSNRLSFWAFRCVVAFLVILSCSALLGALLAPKGMVFESFAPSMVLLALLLIFVPATRWLNARRQFRSAPSAQAPITMTVSDEGVAFRSQYTDSKVAWSLFVRWLDGKSVFALLQSNVVFNVIPKRAFSPDQLAEFREILRRKIGEGKR
jgi:hypothetical protein